MESPFNEIESLQVFQNSFSAFDDDPPSTSGSRSSCPILRAPRNHAASSASHFVGLVSSVLLLLSLVLLLLSLLLLLLFIIITFLLNFLFMYYFIILFCQLVYNPNVVML